MTPARSASRTTSGAAAIEFALILPVFMAILAGLVDWSWYMYEWMSVDMAVNHGVRLGASVKTSPELTALAAVQFGLTTRMVEWESSNLTATKELVSGSYVVKVVAVIPYTPPVGLVPTPDSLGCTASVTWYGDLATP